MFKIINQPSFIPLEEYDIEQEKYINNLKDVPGIVSINNFGNIGAPGLSDLDFLVVVEDDFNPKYAIKLSCKRGLSILEGKLSLNNLRINKDIYNNQILLHGPAVVKRSQLKYLNYIIYVPYLQTLYGEPITDNMFLPSNEELNYLRLMYLIDFSIARMTHFALANELKILDKRGWLTRTWSLTHSKNICDAIGIKLSKSSNNAIEGIKEIRRQWLSGTLCSDELFFKSYKDSENLLIEILTKAIDQEKQHFGDLEFKRKQSSITVGDKKIEFSEKIYSPSARAISSRYKLLKKQKWYFECSMPLQYALHLNAYGFQLSEPITDGIIESNDYIKCLKRRAKKAREHRKFLFSTGLTFAMGAYIGLPIPPYNFIIRNLDKIHWKIHN